jgi:hypothetical protein
VKALGLVVALLLTAGCSGSSTPSKKVSYPKTWDSRVLPIVAFVEKERGHRFRHPVPVSFLADAAFNKQVAVPAPESKKDKAELERSVATLRALGLVSGHLDLVAQLNALTSNNVIGLYVPAKHAVFVRGTTLTPYARTTLAHELTHVLQDQYFDITKLKKDAPVGAEVAVTSLIEADAERVQGAYQKTLSGADQKAFATEEKTLRARGSSAAAKDIPAVLQETESFPYVFGPVLLKILTTQDGNDAVDEAFRKPPTEEAQILDPVGHPATEKARHVATPTLPAGAKKLDKDTAFGQVSLFEVLGSRLPYQASWAAVAGWKGDTYVTYSQAAKTCIAVDVAMKDAASSTLLAGTFSQWARQVPGATVTRAGSQVAIRSCDPGSTAAPLPKAKPSAFDVLTIRAQFLTALLEQKVPFGVAQCTVDGLLRELGPSRYSYLTATESQTQQITVIRELVGTSVQRCRGGG